jgi:hypothetical protein
MICLHSSYYYHYNIIILHHDGFHCCLECFWVVEFAVGAVNDEPNRVSTKSAHFDFSFGYSNGQLGVPQGWPVQPQ